MIRVALLTAGVALLLGCSPSPEQKIELARLTVRSWTSTVEKTTEALERDAVPQVYGRQVVAAAVQGRQKEAGKPEWRMVSAEDRGALDAALRRLASLLRQIDGGADS